jgi:hypothetical protein
MKTLFSLIVMVLLLLTTVSCNTSGSISLAENSVEPDTSGTSTEGFISGEILLTIPLYPGSETTTCLEWKSDGGPPSSSVSRPVYASEDRPGYQSASAQYKVDSTSSKIISWYEDTLGEMGYEKYIEGHWGQEKITGRNAGFFLPSQPLVSVEIHTYSISGFSSLVYELLVVNSIPLPKPEKEAIPQDIDKIEIDYTGYLETGRSKNTITDNKTIVELVEMINSLPVMPDFEFLGGGTGGPEITFTMLFHSESRGNITVKKILGGENSGINVEGYPILDDPHNLLHDRVKELV